MATQSKVTTKYICDRCGNSLEVDDTKKYPSNWQVMELGQTGGQIDLCDTCNDELLVFLNEKNADYMELATHASRKVL